MLTDFAEAETTATGEPTGDAAEHGITDMAVQLECTPMAVAARLGLQPYDWQNRVMADVMPMWSKTALRAANESGKTSRIVVALVMWHLMIFTQGTVVITSGSFRQVEKQVFEALKKQQEKFPGFVFNDTEILAPNGNRAVGFSTDNPGLAEGWHAEDHETGPLLIICDEAKSIPDVIFEAFSRCRPTRLLYMSSPGPAAGAFYRAHTTERAGWKHHKVTAYECPHIDQTVLTSQIAQYGIDNPLIKSMIFADWMLGNATEQFVFPDAKFDAALKSPPAPQTGEIEAFCDFAVSPEGDECVLAVRRGNVVTIEDAWLGSGNTIREAHRFVQLFRKLGLTEDMIAGDVSGIGQAYCDDIATMGFTIQRVNNGEAALQPKRYANVGTETWFEGAARIERGEVIIPFDDERLRKQITTRKYGPTLKGQLQLLSKKKQGGESPDRADAVLGAMRRMSGACQVQDMFAQSGVPGSLNERMNGIDADKETGGPSWLSATI